MDDSSRRERVAGELGRRSLGRDDIAVVPLAPGFSGSAVYRVDVAGTPAWVMKSLAAHMADTRVAWVHGLMRHLRTSGVGQVPEVATMDDGRTIWGDASGGRWEIVGFIAGVPVEAPSLDQAAEAARVLARLHLAAARYPAARACRAAPPAVVRRIAQAGRMLAQPWTDEAFVLRPDATPLQREVAARLGAAQVGFQACGGERLLHAVAAMRPSAVPLQAALRDVSGDHVLFGGRNVAHVAGIIDFHAAAVDTPVTDLARLIASWSSMNRGAAAARREAALTAYVAINPLETDARRLIPFLAATGTLFGLDNWFRWVLAEARGFALPAQVVTRVDRLVAELPAALGELADVASSAV